MHSFEWTWTCAPGCRVVRNTTGWDIVTPSQVVHVTQPVCKPEGMPVEIDAMLEQGLVAPSYGRVREAVWLRWRGKAILPLSVSFMMSKPGERSP